jgi:hypothetical protein
VISEGSYIYHTPPPFGIASVTGLESKQSLVRWTLELPHQKKQPARAANRVPNVLPKVKKDWRCNSNPLYIQ